MKMSFFICFCYLHPVALYIHKGMNRMMNIWATSHVQLGVGSNSLKEARLRSEKPWKVISDILKSS